MSNFVVGLSGGISNAKRERSQATDNDIIKVEAQKIAQAKLLPSKLVRHFAKRTQDRFVAFPSRKNCGISNQRETQEFAGKVPDKNEEVRDGGISNVNNTFKA